MITLTNKAVEQIKKIMKEQELSLTTSLRVGVRGGGCSGFSYTLGFDTEDPNELDQVFEQDGVKIVVDPKSFLYLNGTELDYNDGLMGRGFTFANPGAQKTCGCGESFSV